MNVLFRELAGRLNLEGCQSGRMGRSRKPLIALRSEGSNPSPSAKENKCKIKLLIINMSAVLFFISIRSLV